MKDIEAPFAPKIEDSMTESQNVPEDVKITLNQATEYIKRTKQVISALHHHIELQEQRTKQMRNLLVHCLNHIENPKPRNEILITTAIRKVIEIQEKQNAN